MANDILDKPLVTCTLRDFIEALSGLSVTQAEKSQSKPIGQMPKGLKGIRMIFSCSDYQARKILNSGKIDKAIFHLGARSFVTDADLARQLFNSK